MTIKKLNLKRPKSHFRNLRVISQRVREVQAQQSNWNQHISQRMRRLFWQLAMEWQDPVAIETTKIEQHGIEKRIETTNVSLTIIPIGMLKSGK